MIAEADKATETATEKPKPKKVRLPGVSLIFAWARSDKIGVENGEATDAVGSLRAAMRCVAGVALNTRKQKGWMDRQFTLTFSADDEILMLWNIFSSGTKGGAEHDAGFAGRNALRPLYESVSRGA